MTKLGMRITSTGMNIIAQHSKRKGELEATFEIQLVPDTDCNPKRFECYSAADIASYERGEWGFVGVLVTIAVHNWKTGNHVEYSSAGQWAVEDANDTNHFTEIAKDELNNLLEEHPQLRESFSVVPELAAR